MALRTSLSSILVDNGTIYLLFLGTLYTLEITFTLTSGLMDVGSLLSLFYDPSGHSITPCLVSNPRLPDQLATQPSDTLPAFIASFAERVQPPPSALEIDPDSRNEQPRSPKAVEAVYIMRLRLVRGFLPSSTIVFSQNDHLHAGEGRPSRLPFQQRRTFSTSLSRLNDKKPTSHTADSYFKDVDRAPPPSEKTYEVDSSNPSVQRPNEQMSGEYSRRSQTEGVEDGTYDVPPSNGLEKDQKLRYGGTQRYYDEQGPGSKVSKAEEGPAGAIAGGRKPEGGS
uniref:Nonribosomal peptide synthase sidN (NPRS sidN) (Extracellular siderophore synthetase N)) n=1 Tax=Ganoderma boninense TaxID=34458 RepID=A0A5K1K3X2_9APHY|nr:Nonribosomal peptide synthase sidN (NPRS sidN) (EC (Epichloenin A synthetase) (Extracellular siderophore synthetase N) [Ganoderma boninense]